jgi:glucan biosynthesis protein C
MKTVQAHGERRHDIDWLRVFAVALLFFFHTARIFDTEDFYVKNEQVAEGFSLFVGLIYLWHMPLFFLLSGVGTWYALRSRGPGGYAFERLKRLFIPLIFGSCVIVAPQVYYMHLSGLGYNHVAEVNFHDSYLQFYPKFFNGMAPAGNWEWGHLWFLAYLFTFSLAALPLFTYLRKERGQRLIEKLAKRIERPGVLFLLALPMMAVEASLRASYPGLQNLYNDWSNFFFFMLFFIYGYLLCTDDRFWNAVEKQGKPAFLLGTVLVCIYLLVHFVSGLPSRGYTAGFMLFVAVRALVAWLYVIAALSFGRKYLRFANPTLKYANEAVLPVYVLHQTVIVMLGYYVIRWQAGMMPKYFFITFASVAVTMALYDALVRRLSFLRFLFGMRAKKTKYLPQTSISST